MPKQIPPHCPVGEFYHSTLWIEGDIIFIRYKKNLIITLDVAMDMVRDRKKFAGTSPKWLFTDASELLYINTAARSYLASEEASEFLHGGVVYTPNRLIQVVVAAFLLLDKPRIPVSIFSDELMAMKWLEDFMNLF